MGVVLYRPGDSHEVRGIRCEMQKFDEYSFVHNLSAGWFKSPEECHGGTIIKIAIDSYAAAYAEQEKTAIDLNAAIDSDEDPDITDSLIDANNTAIDSFDLAEAEIRYLAEKQGISGHKIKKIEKLIEALSNGNS